MSDNETRKWPDIELFSSVVRGLQKYHEAGGPPPPTLSYRAKIKLDGTNAAIRYRNGQVEAFQSRTRDITSDDDNAGFARWASGIEWPELFSGNIGAFPIVLIHGEWAGPGVIGGTAVAQIPRKQFFIFAIEQCNETKDPDTGEWTRRWLVTDPAEIRMMLNSWTHPDVYVLPWLEQVYHVDLNDTGATQQFSTDLNNLVAAFELCDPYIEATFGVKGVGEGIVLYPQHVIEREVWQHLAFKAKGEKHREKKAKVAVEVSGDTIASIEAFVSTFVTEARCQHGLRDACGGAKDVKKLGAFIGWMGKDVEKESKVELEAAGLNWKQVSGAVTTAARQWFQKP